MWIECENDATERVYVEDVMDEPVEFNDNGKALVTKEVAEVLMGRYDSITESGDSVDESDDEESDEEADSESDSE